MKYDMYEKNIRDFVETRPKEIPAAQAIATAMLADAIRNGFESLEGLVSSAEDVLEDTAGE